MPRPLQKLSEKHKLFVKHYIDTNNASEAAKLAGYSPKSSAVQGYCLLQEQVIQEYMASIYKQVHINKDRIKTICSKIAEDYEEDKNNSLRACELVAKIDGIIKADNNQNVNVMVDATQRTEDVLARRFKTVAK